MFVRKEAAMSKIELRSKILKKNKSIAEDIRSELNSNGLWCMNLIGSPGSGKTTLLEKTIPLLSKKGRCGVIEGDVKTDYDMKRIAALNIPTVQIETSGSCHLSSEMIKNVLPDFSLEELDFLVIENVGNLICPVAYDLGEDQRLVVVSITEGDEKPLKYPAAFVSADVLVVTKADLEPYVDASVKKIVDNAKSINRNIAVFVTSAKTGEGIDSLTNYISEVFSAKVE